MCIWDCCLMSGGMAPLSLQPSASTTNHGWWAALLNTLKTSLLTVNTIGFQGVKLPEKELKYYISSFQCIPDRTSCHSFTNITSHSLIRELASAPTDGSWAGKEIAGGDSQKQTESVSPQSALNPCQPSAIPPSRAIILFFFLSPSEESRISDFKHIIKSLIWTQDTYQHCSLFPCTILRCLLYSKALSWKTHTTFV